MKITLCLTHKCNLGCRYCYAGNSTKPDMQIDTIQKCIDYGFHTTPDNKCLELCFFGGEPLLRFDLIKSATRYAREQSILTGKGILISITTNGTLINQEVIDFSIQNDVNLCVSIDGPEDLHNRARTFHDGSGSFEIIIKNLKNALHQLGKVQVNTVFGPGTIRDLPRTFEFLIESGFPVIHFNPDIISVWPADIADSFADIFCKIGDLYIKSFENENEIALNLIDGKILLFIKSGYEASDRCAMGDGEWGVAPSGNIYPCERFIRDDEPSPFLIGNIHTGLDFSRRCAVREKRGNHNTECAQCSFSKYCMNWCGCTNYFLSGHSDLATPVQCALEKAIIRSSQQVFDSLVKSGNRTFENHLYNYLNLNVHHH